MDNMDKVLSPDSPEEQKPDSSSSGVSGAPGPGTEFESTEYEFKKPADPDPGPGPARKPIPRPRTSIPIPPPPPLSDNNDNEATTKELFRKLSACTQVMDTAFCEYAAKGVLPPKLSLKKAYAYWNDKANKCMTILDPLPCTQENLKIEKSDGPWRLVLVALDALTQLKCTMDRLDEIPELAENPAEHLNVKGMRNAYNIIRMTMELVLIPTLPTQLANLGGPGKARNPAGLALVQLSEYIKFHRAAYVLQQLFLLSQHRVFATRIFEHKNLLHFLTACIHTSYAPVANPAKPTKNKVGNPLTRDQYEATIAAQVMLRKTFENMIFPRLDKPHVIICLFPIGSDRAPNWFQKKCQDFANSLLCSPKGLVSAINGLAELFSANSNLNLPQCFPKISRVINCLLIQCFTTLAPRTPGFTILMDFFIYEIVTLIRSSIVGDMSQGKHPMEFSMTASALYAGITITELDQDYCVEHLWGNILTPLLTIDTAGDNYKPIKLSQIDQMLYILEIVLSRFQVLGMKFQVVLLHQYFCTLFKIYTACSSYLSANVQLKWASDEIQRTSSKIPEVLASYLVSHHATGQAKPLLSEICWEFMTLRDRRDNASALQLTVKCIDNENEKSVLIGRTEELPQDPISSLFESIQTEAKILVENILHNQRINPGTLQGLFAELMGFEAEVKKGMDKDKVNMESLSLHSLNLGTSNGLKQYAGMVLLAELGKDESLLEKMDMQNGEKSLGFATSVLKTLVAQLKDAEEKGDSFEFTECLESALQIFLTFTQVLKNPNLAKAQESGDSKLDLDISNVHFEDLEEYVHLILAVSESKHPAICNSQIHILAAHTYEEVMSGLKSTSTEKKKKGGQPLGAKTSYHETIANLMDPMVPVIGGGLLQLKKFIEEKNPEAMSDAEKLKTILFRFLHHEDSYIYLSASNALVALGIVKHELIVRPIIVEFSKAKQKNAAEEVVRFRTHCGGCLIKILQAIGDFAPNYRNELMNACFGLMDSDNSDLKSTALLLLASLASVLKFSLSTVLTDMWIVIQNVMKTEKDDQVRRSAMSLLHGVLKGMNSTATAGYFFKDPDIGANLLDMRRKLQMYRQDHRDIPTLHHVSECLNLVSQIGSALMAVDAMPLQKQIHVLRSPSYY